MEAASHALRHQKIVRWAKNTHAAPWVEDQQIVIAADDRLRASSQGEFQIYVVFRVTTLGDPRRWFKPYRFVSQQLQEVLPPSGRDGACKLWPA